MAIEYDGPSEQRAGNFKIGFEDSADMYTNLTDFKDSVVEQAERAFLHQTLDWSQPLSQTPLDGLFLDVEETDIVVNEDPNDDGFYLESCITPIYNFRDKNALGMCVFDYYAGGGMERIGAILEEAQYTVTKQSESILNISNKKARLDVFFGEKPERPEKIHRLFPDTVEYKGNNTDRQHIIARLVTKKGYSLWLDNPFVLQRALMTYAELYGGLIKALYKERKQPVYPAHIFFESPKI